MRLALELTEEVASRSIRSRPAFGFIQFPPRERAGLHRAVRARLRLPGLERQGTFQHLERAKHIKGGNQGTLRQFGLSP
jgi:hypothetical protein